MKALDIKVERTGFPVILAGHEYFFDCSAEHIEKYETQYTEVEKKLNDIKNEDLDSQKEALGLGFDVMLKPGAFEELYHETPDVIAWGNAFFDLADGIARNIDSFKKEQENKSDQLKNKYLNKKSSKRGR